MKIISPAQFSLRAHTPARYALQLPFGSAADFVVVVVLVDVADDVCAVC